MRTAATTAVATDILAPLDASCLVHFGVGKISELLVRGVLKVRPSIRKIVLVRRDAGKRPPDWLDRLERGVEVELKDPVSALLEADVITTATSSKTPVIPPHAEMSRLRHINLIGSNHLKRREIPDEVARKCLPPGGYLVADDPSQAAIEAGDFTGLAKSGMFDWMQVPSLAQLLDDPAEKEKAARAKLTAFKSVGIGLLDVAISAGILRRMGIFGPASSEAEAANAEE
jgi:ornithine cyclodeaminase/alanine dehydrogenase-like protein (mu-crystallin family)